MGRSCWPFPTTNIWIYEHATHIFVWGRLLSQVLPLLKLTAISGHVSCLFPNVKSLGTFTAKRMLMGYFWEKALRMENTGAEKCIFETHLSTLSTSQSILWWEAGEISVVQRELWDSVISSLWTLCISFHSQHKESLFLSFFSKEILVSVVPSIHVQENFMSVAILFRFQKANYFFLP